MKRAFALLVPAVLVVGLVACGDDDDSPDTTTATEATEPQTDDTATDATDAATTTESGDGEAGGSVADSQTELLGQIFPNLNGEQIDCLVGELGDAAEDFDPAQAQAAADACDIDPDDLVPDMSAVSLPDLGDVSVPENMDEIIGQVFPSLDDEQVSCLVDAIGDDFDASKAAQLADDCNIDPADLVPG